MDKLETLWAREQIRDLLHTYCHGIDRRDWDLVRSCFGEDLEHSHASFAGNADEFIEFASGFLNEVAVSHHSVSNAKIEIAEDGKSAHSDANFIAFHMIEDGKVPNLAKQQTQLQAYHFLTKYKGLIDSEEQSIIFWSTILLTLI